MWNPFKTLAARDSARLRRLENDFNQLADDVEMCVNIIPKINARLRQRAIRASATKADELDEEVVEPTYDDAVKAITSGDHEALPRFSKEQLRGFARAKGLRV